MIKLDKVKGIPKCRVIFPGGSIALEMYGQTIEQVFEAYDRKFPINTVVEIGNQMLSVLKSVHKLGLVHGNITPRSIAVGTYKSMFLLHMGEEQSTNTTTVEDDFTSLFSVLAYLETGGEAKMVKDPVLREMMKTRVPQEEKPLVWVKDHRNFYTPRVPTSNCFNTPVCGFHWDIASSNPASRLAGQLHVLHRMASGQDATLPVRWISSSVVSDQRNPHLLIHNKFNPATQFVISFEEGRFPRAMNFCGSRLFAFSRREGVEVVQPVLGACATLENLKNIATIADGMVATQDGTVAVRLVDTTEVCRVRGQVLAFAMLDGSYVCFALTDTGFLYRITSAGVRGTQLADSFSSRRTTAIVVSTAYVAVVGSHGAIFVRQTPRMQLLAAHRITEPVLTAKFVDKHTCFLVSSCQLTMINLKLGHQRQQPVPLIYRAVVDRLNRIHCIAKRELADMFTDQHYTRVPPFNGVFMVSSDGMCSVMGVDPRSPWMIDNAVYTTLYVIQLTTEELGVIGRKRKLETDPPIRPPEPALDESFTNGLELLAEIASTKIPMRV